MALFFPYRNDIMVTNLGFALVLAAQLIIIAAILEDHSKLNLILLVVILQVRFSKLKKNKQTKFSCDIRKTRASMHQENNSSHTHTHTHTHMFLIRCY